MIHDCAGFDAWLDGGRDAALEASANAHAAGCARCAGALDLESLLAAPPAARTDAAFTEGVLFRVRDARRAAAAARLVLAGAPSPWWLRAPAEPPAALALVAAALLVWRGDGLWSLALALAGRATAHDWSRGPGWDTLATIARALPALPTSTAGSAAVLAVLLPVVAVASWALYHLIERWVADAGSRSSAPALPGWSPGR